MPSLDLTFGAAGPLLQVHIGLSLPHLEALQGAGRAVPPMVRGTFLIDTGASHSAVDPDLIEPPGLSPTGSAAIQTPSTGTGFYLCDEYDVMLHLPNDRSGRTDYIIEALPIITAPFREQGIDGLIGRDVLSNCVLVVNGPAGQAILSY